MSVLNDNILLGMLYNVLVRSPETLEAYVDTKCYFLKFFGGLLRIVPRDPGGRHTLNSIFLIFFFAECFTMCWKGPHNFSKNVLLSMLATVTVTQFYQLRHTQATSCPHSHLERVPNFLLKRNQQKMRTIFAIFIFFAIWYDSLV